MQCSENVLLIRKLCWSRLINLDSNFLVITTAWLVREAIPKLQSLIPQERLVVFLADSNPMHFNKTRSTFSTFSVQEKSYIILGAYCKIAGCLAVWKYEPKDLHFFPTCTGNYLPFLLNLQLSCWYSKLIDFFSCYVEVTYSSDDTSLVCFFFFTMPFFNLCVIFPGFHLN